MDKISNSSKKMRNRGVSKLSIDECSMTLQKLPGTLVEIGLMSADFEEV
ncbi:hypothetical protein Desor_1951 [Desulfosporosinus orientis DSM 765]|uniref:Uncharacterized protein n=1 Tax=Desulfosporosinus orientis (strain ATCC 19365 / DSM 765 / NCIMB 8382 / VKM B-1628 / Singapore I) TaxID=768706 RepID=G7WD84_DESOD|nr:hypothetical protein Desor_1951 [Desulfosporosinus orientis DSM 765]